MHSVTIQSCILSSNHEPCHLNIFFVSFRHATGCDSFRHVTGRWVATLCRLLPQCCAGSHVQAPPTTMCRLPPQRCAGSPHNSFTGQEYASERGTALTLPLPLTLTLTRTLPPPPLPLPRTPHGCRHPAQQLQRARICFQTRRCSKQHQMHHLPRVCGRRMGIDSAKSWYGARFFDGGLHSRMPLVPTHVRFKRTCVCPMAFLSGVNCSYRCYHKLCRNTEGAHERECTPITECVAGQFIRVPATSSSDLACAECDSSRAVRFFFSDRFTLEDAIGSHACSHVRLFA
jgi:hypothetical protein